MRTSCRAKANDPRKIVDRASLEHAHRAGLEGERHGVAGGECQVARGFLRHHGHQLDAHVGGDVHRPGRGRASRVTRPVNTLRAEEGSGSRLTKMSVGGTARMAGPVRSVTVAIKTVPTRTCFSPFAPSSGSSTRNRFSGATGEGRPPAR